MVTIWSEEKWKLWEPVRKMSMSISQYRKNNDLHYIGIPDQIQRMLLGMEDTFSQYKSKPIFCPPCFIHKVWIILNTFVVAFTCSNCSMYKTMIFNLLVFWLSRPDSGYTGDEWREA